MQVVATQKGLYGVVRERGDLFELTDAAHKSKRWMVEADSAEGKALLRDVGKSAKGVSDDVITAELTAATGKAGAIYKAENAKLTARVKELEARIAELEAELSQRPKEPAAPAEPADEEDADADADADAIKKAETAPEDVAPPVRVTRRSRG